MKKQIPTLTEEEKIKFCAHLNSGKAYIYNRKKTISIALILPICITPLPLFLIPLVPATFSWLIIPIYSFYCLSIWTGALAAVFKHIKQDNMQIKIASSGKLTFRDAYKLYKSGEIKKWKSEYRQQINQYVNKLNNINTCDYNPPKEEQPYTSITNKYTNKKHISLKTTEKKKLENELTK